MNEPEVGIGSEVALWKVVDGGHVPDVTPDFTKAVVDWLDSHARAAG